MKKDYTDLMQKLCDKYSLEFWDMGDPEVQAKPCNQFKSFFEQFNEQSASMFDELHLGIYKDKEQRLIDFFYVLAIQVSVQEKLIPKNYDEYPYHNYPQAIAWKTALILAEENGIKFTKERIDKEKELFRELFKDNNPECSPVVFLPEAEYLAFGEPIEEAPPL